MTDRISALLLYIREKKHHAFRREPAPGVERVYRDPALSDMERVTERFELALALETPVLLPGEKIVFTRTVKNLPDALGGDEWAEKRAGHFIHELGRVCNVCPDYASTIARGLSAGLERCRAGFEGADNEQRIFLNCVIRSIGAVLGLAGRYRAEASARGRADVAGVLSRVPLQGARTFPEALQFFRILHFALWAEGEYHNTIGRFDQYMFPYLRADLEAGRLDEAGALELLEEFFLTFNRDSDLYPGIQQGDNGQSMMLGGRARGGSPGFNLLSEMCLGASCELRLIDPKINLRVDSKTPLRVFELGTRLTRAGLGFPQYSNDDVVIPGLVRKGYAPEDAADYTVAACWEFIVPGRGMDIPNIAAVNLPRLVNLCMLGALESARDFDGFFASVEAALRRECREQLARLKNLYMLPAPFLSLMMADRVERRRDVSFGARYNNFGFHGVGFSEAVDALASLKRNYFDAPVMDFGDIRAILTEGFGGREGLRHRLRYEDPKFGDGDEAVDAIACRLLGAFADAADGLVNERGGCVRAGTGSAMYYLWHAREAGCTVGGRVADEALSANYSPALYARCAGPLSVVRSFTRPDLRRAVNGGPLTMEFHAAVFAGGEAERKVALLVKRFIGLGGHQLQLNAVSREELLDAQARPEAHRNLIVRVWGWSAYFVELDREYQDHVIARQEYAP